VSDALEPIRIALETHLDAITPALATQWENDSLFVPPDADTPYQASFFMPAEPDNEEMGSTHYTELGVYQVSLFYPLKGGQADARTRAGLIRSAFKRGTSLTNAGVTVTVQRTPMVGQGSRDGEMWFVPVRIRWFANI
jgi:hypothetical protein